MRTNKQHSGRSGGLAGREAGRRMVEQARNDAGGNMRPRGRLL